MTGLTPRQRQCLEFIRDYMRRNGGVSPSLIEIGDALGLSRKSRAFARDILINLETRGHIRRQRGKTRSIEIVEPGEVRLSPHVRDMVADYAKRTNCSLQTATNEILSEHFGMVTR